LFVVIYNEGVFKRKGTIFFVDMQMENPKAMIEEKMWCDYISFYGKITKNFVISKKSSKFAS
jgi:hypothetical protein